MSPAIVGLAIFAFTIPVSIFAAQIGFYLAVATQAWAWLRKRQPFVRTPLDLYLLGYLVAEVVSLAFSQDRPQHLHHMKRLFLPVMFYVAAHAVRSTRAMAWTIGPLLVMANLLSILGIVRHLSGPAGLEHRVRFWQHVLTTSDLLMMADLIALGLLLRVRDRRVRAFAGVTLLLVSSCLVFTYSRSAWFGALAGALVMLGFVRPRLIALVAVLGVAGMLVAPASIRDRLLSGVNPHHPGNAERVNMWRAGIAIVRDHPWTGIGDIGTEHHYVRYAPNPTRELAGHLHSNVVMLAVMFGIPGLIVMMILFVRILVMLLSFVRDSAGGGPGAAVQLGALGAYVGFQVIGLFEWNFGDAEIALTLWMLLGVALAAQRMKGAPVSTRS
jgi:putative inorganic carbon (HCO3(-)) transporter